MYIFPFHDITFCIYIFVICMTSSKNRIDKGTFYRDCVWKRSFFIYKYIWFFGTDTRKKNKIGKTYNQIKESYVWILSCVYKIYICVCVWLYVTQLAKDSNKAIQKKKFKRDEIGWTDIIVYVMEWLANDAF